MFPLNINLTKESIAHQTNTKLFKALVGACNDLLNGHERIGKSTTPEGFRTLRTELDAIANVVKNETNLILDLSIEQNPRVNASVDIGAFGYNHPFFKWAHDHFTITDDDAKAPRDVAKMVNSMNEAIGWVDRKNVKVHGIFSKIEFPTKISYGTLLECEADVIAAILLHEIGHAWTLLEYLSGIVTRNYAMGAVAQAIMGQTERENKVLIIDTLKHELTNKTNYPHLENQEYQSTTGRKFQIHGDILDTQTVVDSKSGEELTLYLMNAAIKPFYSDNGNYFYDSSGAEFLADQFAARLGATGALVKGLHHIHAMHMERSILIRCLVIAVELIVLIHPIAALVVIASIGLTPYQLKQYDDPKDRITRLRNELVDALKNMDLKPEDRHRYVKDIEYCNTLLTEYNRYFSIIAFVSRMIFPSKRRAYNDMLMQKKLEGLANNNLFATATKFELSNS